MKFAEEAAASGAIDEASDVLDAARKSLAKPIMQAQAAQRAAKAALARARTPADKAEREKKAAEAQAELDAIKSAQSALAECAKGLQQARREHEAIQAAQERLKTAPDDAGGLPGGRPLVLLPPGRLGRGPEALGQGERRRLEVAGRRGTGVETLQGRRQGRPGRCLVGPGREGRGQGQGRHAAACRSVVSGGPAGPGAGAGEIEGGETSCPSGRASRCRSRAAGPRRLRPPLAVAPFNEKTAKQHQARWAKYLRVPVVQTNSIGMKLVLIPPGEFQMGSPKELIEEELRLHGDDGWYKDHLPGEGPQHRVRITKPYWLGATDVTQEEYQRVMGSNPSKFQGDPKRPVEQVSWDDAVEFCRRLSELPGEKAAKRQYGLPTEAQWEYACRAGTTTRWYSGDNEAGLSDVAWFNANAGGQTHPVGQKRANAWGLYDMHGNVWEWCQDWYDKEYYAKSPMDDPDGPPGGVLRVLRGHSISDPAWTLRSAFRNFEATGYRCDSVGFRVSLVPVDNPRKPQPAAQAGDLDRHVAEEMLGCGATVRVVTRSAWKSLRSEKDLDRRLGNIWAVPSLSDANLLPKEPFCLVSIERQMLPTTELVDNWRSLQGNLYLRLRQLNRNDPAGRALVHVPSLIALDLFESGCSDDDFACLSDLWQLEWLGVQRTGISDRSLRIIADFHRLSFLNVSDTRVTDAGLESLKSLKSLETLRMSGNGLDGSGLAALTTLPSLHFLTLAACHRLDDRSVVALSRLTYLTFLELYGTKLTAAGVAKLHAALPNCKIIVDSEIQAELDKTKKK